MKFTDRQDPEAQFQIAPMMDIVFLLLIFFIATYAATQMEKLIDISLPPAQSAEAEKRKLDQILVDLNGAGEIFLYRRPLTVEQLEQQLETLTQFSENPSVIVRADGACPHRHVIAVMDVCRRKGVDQISFSAVSPKKAADADAP